MVERKRLGYSDQEHAKAAAKILRDTEVLEENEAAAELRIARDLMSRVRSDVRKCGGRPVLLLGRIATTFNGYSGLPSVLVDAEGTILDRIDTWTCIADIERQLRDRGHSWGGRRHLKLEGS